MRLEDGTPLNLGISLLDPKQDGQTDLSPIADTIRLATADRRVEYFTNAVEKAGEGLKTPQGTEDIQQWINDLREGKDTPAVEILDLLNRGLNASLSGYEYQAITQAGNTVFTPEFFRAQALTHKPDTRDIPETPLETQAHNDSTLPADKVGIYHVASRSSAKFYRGWRCGGMLACQFAISDHFLAKPVDETPDEGIRGP